MRSGAAPDRLDQVTLGHARPPGDIEFPGGWASSSLDSESRSSDPLRDRRPLDLRPGASRDGRSPLRAEATDALRASIRSTTSARSGSGSGTTISSPLIFLLISFEVPHGLVTPCPPRVVVGARRAVPGRQGSGASRETQRGLPASREAALYLVTQAVLRWSARDHAGGMA